MFLSTIHFTCNQALRAIQVRPLIWLSPFMHCLFGLTFHKLNSLPTTWIHTIPSTPSTKELHGLIEFNVVQINGFGTIDRNIEQHFLLERNGEPYQINWSANRFGYSPSRQCVQMMDFKSSPFLWSFQKSNNAIFT